MNIYENEPPPSPSVKHYYGDVVRAFFVIGGVIMILTLPIFAGRIAVSFHVSLFIIVVVGVLAGLTNPRQAWVSVINAAVSMIAFLTFEYYAVASYAGVPLFSNWFFLVNQVLAVDFFLALYYSAKTARGMYMRGRIEASRGEKPK